LTEICYTGGKPQTKNKMKVLVIGAGLFGCTCARLLADAGHKVKVIERGKKPGGICRDERRASGLIVHTYGPHIFHTDNEQIWSFINRFTSFNNYVHRVFSFVGGQYISFPPNKLTYQQLGIKGNGLTKDEHSLIFEKLFRDYSRKMWGEDCFIGRPGLMGNTGLNVVQAAMKRIKWRDTFETRMFLDKYQGIPINGYSAMFDKMLEGIDVEYGRTFYHKDLLASLNEYHRIIYSGSLDVISGYSEGELEYRTINFLEREVKDNLFGNAVINFPEWEVPYTRATEHKYFYPDTADSFETSVVTYEVPASFRRGEGQERMYPVNDCYNTGLYKRYKEKLNYSNLYFGGRLGSYQYLDMDKVMWQAFSLVRGL